MFAQVKDLLLAIYTSNVDGRVGPLAFDDAFRHAITSPEATDLFWQLSRDLKTHCGAINDGGDVEVAKSGWLPRGACSSGGGITSSSIASWQPDVAVASSGPPHHDLNPAALVVVESTPPQAADRSPSEVAVVVGVAKDDAVV